MTAGEHSASGPPIHQPGGGGLDITMPPKGACEKAKRVAPMDDDQPRDLVARFYAAAEAAALRREWHQVLELVDDLLVLDQHHVEALNLRTIAERHVDRSSIEAGRRHETVLFADLVGSTELANHHDPEFVRRLIRSYEVACTPVLS